MPVRHKDKRYLTLRPSGFLALVLKHKKNTGRGNLLLIKIAP